MTSMPDTCTCATLTAHGKLQPQCPVHGRLVTERGPRLAALAAEVERDAARAAADAEAVAGLTLLGRTGTGAGTPQSIAADRIETFPRPEHVHSVVMRSDEFTAVCPVTGQPDQYVIEVEYAPRDRCIESKALKLYLQGFRNAGVFCEALASRIAGELRDAVDADLLAVTLTQKARGGVLIEAKALVSRVTAARQTDDGG